MKIEIKPEAISKSLAMSMHSGEQQASIELKIPILGLAREYKEGTLFEIELMADKHLKGWLYAKVKYIAVKVNGKFELVNRQDLQDLVELLCRDKVFSDHPKMGRITKTGNRVVTYLDYVPFEY